MYHDMECRIISWNKRARTRRAPGQTHAHARGFSLVEYMIAIAVGGLVILTIVSLMMYSSRSFAGLANYADLNMASLRALDRMTRDIRQAVRLTSYSPTQLVFSNGTSNQSLVFAYNPNDRTLIRKDGTRSEVLLTECDSLKFSIFQRTPMPGTYDQYPAATADNCKVVMVNWVCSRKLLGSRFNTESVHTAKIVIRKH